MFLLYLIIFPLDHIFVITSQLIVLHDKRLKKTPNYLHQYHNRYKEDRMF